MQGCRNGAELVGASKRVACRARRQTGHEWRRAVQEGMPQAAQVSLRADEAAVPELLNLAWARHEIDSDAAAQVHGSVCSPQEDGAGVLLTVLLCMALH